ncbi:hypothetical protein [Changchengzhania lutea]|uniref:hypothetical protein n=1 Tax=Changchengzhania lutea TaxID=2049305 RepID=UPI00115D28B3|nr:hypothetical protein [Changchengzhania lutea]
MENGYVILGLIALLFLSMYGYAYASVAFEKLKQNRARKNELLEEEARRLESIRKQEERDEKVRKFNKRKEEIQHELLLLEKMKKKQKVG